MLMHRQTAPCSAPGAVHFAHSGIPALLKLRRFHFPSSTVRVWQLLKERLRAGFVLRRAIYSTVYRGTGTTQWHKIALPSGDFGPKWIAEERDSCQKRAISVNSGAGHCPPGSMLSFWQTEMLLSKKRLCWFRAKCGIKYWDFKSRWQRLRWWLSCIWLSKKRRMRGKHIGCWCRGRSPVLWESRWQIDNMQCIAKPKHFMQCCRSLEFCSGQKIWKLLAETKEQRQI